MTWHNVRGAAQALKLSEESIYLLCSSGRLGHRRIGLKPGRGRIEISDAHIAAYLESCEVPVAPQGGHAPGAKKRPKIRTFSGRPDGKPLKYDWD